MAVPVRVAALVDGFNLYHAVRKLGANHLKWLCLRFLCEEFAPVPQYELEVHYFSAYAKWLPGPYSRHQGYVKALRETGVIVHMARFKDRPQYCKRCGNQWTAHEEKETDVSIGISLLDAAYQGGYGRILLLTNDSDLVPAVRLTRRRFPQLEIQLLTPPGHTVSYDLKQSGCNRHTSIKRVHIERSLLPSVLQHSDGSRLVRPQAYDPPT